METSLIVAATAIGGNILVAVGLVKTWNRNGRDAASKYGSLQTEVKNTGQAVSSLTSAVKEMNGKVDKLAVASGRQDERLHSAEDDIKTLFESDRKKS